jgi:phosphoenolpyruvate-protein phosphotransferase (PTS system enzyme I)
MREPATSVREAPRVRLHGLGVSAGKASGPVFVAGLAAGAAAPPAPDFATAVKEVADRLERLAAESRPAHPEAAAILEAQALMAADPALGEEFDAERAAGTPPDEAAVRAADRLAARLEALEDEYLRQRSADVREVGRLLAAAFRGTAASRLAGLRTPAVVVAGELSPADTLSADRRLLLAIVTETGGPTSHAAIVARELGIPAVVGASGALVAARRHPEAAVDGTGGEVVFGEGFEVTGATRTAAVLHPAAAPVPLLANVSSSAVVVSAAERGAQGVGLFRTELLFMSASGPMSEDEQASVYAAACAAMAPHMVVVRTLDTGADKPLPYLETAAEPNPQLGRRGIRFWLGAPQLWRPQVRALVRTAAAHDNLWVMLPMIAAREEMVAARELFRQEAEKLGGRQPRIGMMVEVPGVAAALDAFEGVADFISLGTNDLTQYTVAADRGLAWGTEYSEFNPGVLRLIARAAADATALGMHSSVCGELAGRPEGAVFAAGAGIRSLSMTADSLQPVADALARLGLAGCEEAAGRALQARTAEAALAAIRQFLTEP